ncbi:MAG TPA: PQQ-binding-like beta-propeller repeat protein [bacterium]|nr:PQQ-binding-like beta-propeller repeat protein [bacterium]HPN33503.1 PQQ-binding-like beta-propeller repeat protein [bacterium]
MKRALSTGWIAFGLLFSCRPLTVQQEAFDPSSAWLQHGGNPGRSASISSAPAWPLELKWTYRTSATAMPTLLAKGQRVYVSMMDGRQVVLRLQDGKKLARIRLPANTPYALMLAGEKLVLLRGQGENNLQSCHLPTGRFDWRRTIGPCQGEPLLVGSRIYVARSAGTLSAYALEDGRELCSVALHKPPASTPSFGHGRIILAVEPAEMRAFTLDLQPEWAFTAEGIIRSAPVCRDSVLYFGTTAGTFYALQMRDGSVKWRQQVSGGLYQAAAVDDSLVVFGCTDHHVYALTTATGRLRWRFATAAPISTSPLLCADAVVIGSMDKTLYAISRQRGRQVWSFTAQGRWRGGPILAQNHLLCAAEDDRIYCFASP